MEDSLLAKNFQNYWDKFSYFNIAIATLRLTKWENKKFWPTGKC